MLKDWEHELELSFLQCSEASRVAGKPACARVEPVALVKSTKSLLFLDFYHIELGLLQAYKHSEDFFNVHFNVWLDLTELIICSATFGMQYSDCCFLLLRSSQ